MSALTIYSDKDASQHQWHSTDAAEIAQQLNAKGVRFERWAGVDWRLCRNKWSMRS